MIEKLANNSLRVFWKLNLAGWVGYAVLNWLMGIAAHDKPMNYVEPSLMYAAGGVAITYGLRHIYKAAWGLRPALNLLVSGLGAILAATLFAGFKSFIYVHVYEGLRLGTIPFSEYFYSWEITLSLYVIGTWSGLYYGIKNYNLVQQQREQVLRATSMAHQAQLRTLRHQLNPHFLYNTLNAISTLVLEGENRTADRMLSGLSAFLRFSLDRDPEQKIPLREEVDALDIYLGLERIRFADRLEIELDISEEALDALVPSMILQPAVENAIRHAVTFNELGGRITVAGRIENDMLLLCVADTGPGVPGPGDGLQPADTGHGLENTRERLQVLYGPAYSFSVTDLEPQGLKVEIGIPRERCDP